MTRAWGLNYQVVIYIIGKCHRKQDYSLGSDSVLKSFTESTILFLVKYRKLFRFENENKFRDNRHTVFVRIHNIDSVPVLGSLVRERNYLALIKRFEMK